MKSFNFQDECLSRVLLNVEPEEIQDFSCDLVNNECIIKLTLINKHPHCEYCGGECKSKGTTKTTIRTLDTNGMPTKIIWSRRRYTCKVCKKTFSEPNVLTPEGLTCSYTVINKVLNLLRNPHATYSDVANEVHISSTQVERYFDSYVVVPRLTLPTNLGIDEICSSMAKYGGAYICTLVDNNNGNLIDVLGNRSKITLSKYFESIPLSERKNVKFVTIDMWETYYHIAKKYLPNAIVAVDPFHVVKNMMADFDKFRIKVMKQYPKDSTGYYLLKNWNDLFHSDVDLDNEPKYNKRFQRKVNLRQLYDALRGLNQSLTKASDILDNFRLLVENGTEEDCKERLNSILKDIRESGLTCYENTYRFMTNWKQEILNSFIRPDNKCKLSNSKTENMNGKLRVLIVNSRGLNNFSRFRNRALFCFNRNVKYSISETLSSNAREGKKRGKYNKSIL